MNLGLFGADLLIIEMTTVFLLLLVFFSFNFLFCIGL